MECPEGIIWQKDDIMMLHKRMVGTTTSSQEDHINIRRSSEELSELQNIRNLESKYCATRQRGSRDVR
jgi:hypothetical protein